MYGTYVGERSLGRRVVHVRNRSFVHLPNLNTIVNCGPYIVTMIEHTPEEVLTSIPSAESLSLPPGEFRI